MVSPQSGSQQSRSLENVTVKIKFRDPITCRECGYKIMCKKKTKQTDRLNKHREQTGGYQTEGGRGLENYVKRYKLPVMSDLCK